MELSSKLCRVQETIQRDRAATATLENTRIIAAQAATAWGAEALFAERREARRERARIIADEAAVPHVRIPGVEESLPSENKTAGSEALG